MLRCMSSSLSGGTEGDQTPMGHSINDHRITCDSPIHISDIFQCFAFVMLRGCAGHNTELTMSRQYVTKHKMTVPSFLLMLLQIENDCDFLQTYVKSKS